MADGFSFRSEPCRVDKLKGACITKVEAGAFHSLALSSIGEVSASGFCTGPCF